jgi:hypothetical protein
MASSAPQGLIEFEIVGNQRGVQEMLNTIDSALSVIGMAAFLHGQVAPWVKARAKDRFASEGDDVSGPWAPLAETTIEIREGSGFGAGPINIRTHELERYITQSNADVVSAPGAATLRYPGTVPPSKGLREKMRTAQKGRSQPKTVARPVLGLNERDLSVILTQLAFHIQGEGMRRRA